MKQRIWELDAIRGICILGMVLVHVCFDLLMFKILQPTGTLYDIFHFLSQWGGVLFFLISGICVTLGSHPIRRGLMVFGAGLLCTLVTAGMYLAGMMSKSIIIYFGVLHCLGICMLLWPLLKKLPVWGLGILGIVIIAVGFYIKQFRVETFLLVPLGWMPHFFASSDYFPILPNLGYFLMGIVLGRTLYRKKTSLLPKVNPNNPLLRFFNFFGKHSLPIYLLHQPLVYAVIYGYILWRY